MPITIAQLLVKLNADTTSAEAGLARVGKLLGPGGALGLGVLAAGAGVVALGGLAVHMAGDFQASMVQLVTGAGESRGNLKLVSDGILQMAKDTGESTQQLAAGAFMIESAGYHGADALTVLKNAAEGAKVGNADLGTVSDATTTLMKDFGISASNSGTAVNALIATVAQGKTHMQDLAMSLSEVAPTASAAGISMNDMLGAMATMTGEGVPAANAATYLRQTILALTAPGTLAQKTLKDIGLSSADVANDLKNKGLPATLAEITDAVGKKFPVGSAGYVAALKDISGGSRTMQGMLDLTGSHMKDFQAAVGGVASQVKKGGSSIVGWSDVQKTFNFQFDRAKEVVQTLMIQLGEKLLPVATSLFKFFADTAIPTITKFVSWISGTSTSATIFKVVLIAVAGAIAGLLVAAFVAWAIAAGAAAVATIAATWPVLAIGAAVALLIVGIMLLHSHWKQVSDWLGSVWNNIVGGVKAGLIGLVDWMNNLEDGMRTAIKNGLNTVIGEINAFIRFIDSIQIHIPAIGVGPVKSPAFNWGGLGIGQIPYLAEGGNVRSAGYAVVGERGPEVVSLSSGARVTPLGGGSAGGSQTIIVQLDGRVLTQAVVKNMPREIRLATGTRSF